MIGKFEQLNMERQRRAGEVLDVVDIASLPFAPVFPNRAMIAVAGLCFGVLIGGISVRFREPGNPAFAGPAGDRSAARRTALHAASRTELKRIVIAG
jgi:hypothetical protein